jgi:hypothetical protein
MYQYFGFRDVLASSVEAARQVEDVPPPGAKLDFKRRFLPETLARTGELASLSGSEETRHIHLSKLFHPRFAEAFGTPFEAIGPAEATTAEAALSSAPRDRVAAAAPALS